MMKNGDVNVKGDKIRCLNCKKTFVDDTKIKMQDSRNGHFKNMCPYCYSNKTKNLVECKEITIPKKEREKREKNRCEICQADISDRGNRSIRCKSCEKEHRAEYKILNEQKNALLADSDYSPEEKSFVEHCCSLSEGKLRELWEQLEFDTSDRDVAYMYRVIITRVEEKKFHKKVSSYEQKLINRNLEKNVLGYTQAFDIPIDKKKQSENTMCKAIDVEKRENRLHRYTAPESRRINWDRAKHGWTDYYDDGIITTNPCILWETKEKS